MVYLVRTSTMIGFDEEVETKTRELVGHMQKTYPQIREVKFLWNVTGPVNEVHWVLTFDSLADEEKWSKAVLKDEMYTGWWMQTMGKIFTPFVDRMYKEAEM